MKYTKSYIDLAEEALDIQSAIYKVDKRYRGFIYCHAIYKIMMEEKTKEINHETST